MKTSCLNTAVGLLFAVAGTVPGADAAGIKRSARKIHQKQPRHYHIVASPANNTTSSASSYLTTTTCALEIVTLTTTVDITTTIIAPAVTETPCSTHQGWNNTIASTSSSTSEPCADGITTISPTITMTLSVSSSSKPCTDSSASADATVTSLVSSTTTEPCDSSSSPTVTPFSTSSQTTVYPIDTSITPITTAGPTLTTTEIVTNTLPPTTTVCETSAPTGTPAPRAVHCGVHGLPVGDFFLGRYVEEQAGVPVSLEGCWAFCKTAWGATNGCQSYDYYLNELGAPRCDLYSSRVAFTLDRVDNNEPNLWFDLECGNPTDPKWTHSHPHTARAVGGAAARSIRGGKRV